MFRKAVATIEGSVFLAAAGNVAECSSRVKADILFSYQLPVNLVALCIMLPASYILSPRWFHKVDALKHEFISSYRCFFSGQRLHDKVRVLWHNGNRDANKYSFKGWQASQSSCSSLSMDDIPSVLALLHFMTLLFMQSRKFLTHFLAHWRGWVRAALVYCVS